MPLAHAANLVATLIRGFSYYHGNVFSFYGDVQFVRINQSEKRSR